MLAKSKLFELTLGQTRELVDLHLESHICSSVVSHNLVVVLNKDIHSVVVLVKSVSGAVLVHPRVVAAHADLGGTTIVWRIPIRWLLLLCLDV